MHLIVLLHTVMYSTHRYTRYINGHFPA